MPLSSACGACSQFGRAAGTTGSKRPAGTWPLRVVEALGIGCGTGAAATERAALLLHQPGSAILSFLPFAAVPPSVLDSIMLVDRQLMQRYRELQAIVATMQSQAAIQREEAAAAKAAVTVTPVPPATKGALPTTTAAPAMADQAAPGMWCLQLHGTFSHTSSHLRLVPLLLCASCSLCCLSGDAPSHLHLPPPPPRPTPTIRLCPCLCQVGPGKWCLCLRMASPTHQLSWTVWYCGAHG